MKTKEERSASKEEVETVSRKPHELTDEELGQVTGGSVGSDTEGLRFSGKQVPLPEARSKKEIDGGYAGKTVPDPTDEQMINIAAR